MKKVFLATAGVAAAALMGAGAAQAATGYIGINYGSGTQDTDGLSSWGGNGAVAFDGGESLGFQLDGGFAAISADGVSGDETLFNVGGHVFTRNETNLFGGFVNYATGDESDISQWNVGGEAQFYTSQTTIGVSGAWGNVDLSGSEADVWSVGGDLKFFPEDNFSLGGGVVYNKINDADTDYVSWNIGAEYQFDSAWSVGFGYQTAQIDPADLGFFKLSGRYNFGGHTLKDRSQKGAGLNQRGGFINDLVGGN